ncbi:MAG TPA: EamA family transporter [Acetobacteraceae bacterium]|nr:EamA family transporter [Acetobacteraceae bacterium]
MAIILALLSALSYGGSDFLAGLASRRGNEGVVLMLVQPFGLVAALLALAWFRGAPPGIASLAWGAASGIGSGIGTAMLYRGLAIGRMSVVAPLSAVVAAIVPVVAGIFLGQKLSAPALAGIAAAIPAIGLVSWQRDEANGRDQGVFYGLIAGFGFALLFVALDRAGTAAGAWPLVPGQAVANLVVIPFAWQGIRGQPGWRSSVRSSAPSCVAAGLLAGAAALLFLAASGRGYLAVVAVISSLYPAATILLARMVLGERLNRTQAAGLLAAAAAVILISIG